MEALITSISMDGGTQSRGEIDIATVESFADAMHNGDKFPPIELYHDGDKYWLADGFHRVRAALLLGMDTIDATVKQGTREAAAWASCGANHAHGLRRTNADKRRAVEMALRLHPEKNDQAVADHCGVAKNTVSNHRKSVSQNDKQQEPTTRTGKDGKEYPTTHKPRTEPEPKEETTPTNDRYAPRPDEVLPPEKRLSNAANFCAYAQEQLERIDATDPYGVRELSRHIDWCRVLIERLENE